MKNSLVKLFGFPALLIHGDTLVLDRWIWLRARLPRTRNGERLIDIGCGSGAFSIGAAKRGYKSLGLSWDERNQAVARERAAICRVSETAFEVQDVRRLAERGDLREQFDVAVCFENIEHILDDRLLFKSIADCLKPGGRLLLTAPNYYYKAMTKEDEGPFSRVEDGAHVRRGYTNGMLLELCREAGMQCEELSSCSGAITQLATKLMRHASKVHALFGWLAVLPLRPFPPLFDTWIKKLVSTTDFSICMVAYKPRFISSPAAVATSS